MSTRPPHCHVTTAQLHYAPDETSGRILTPTFARTAWQKTSACLPPARELARPRAPVRSGVRSLVEDRFRWRLRRSEAPETIRSGTLRYWLC